MKEIGVIILKKILLPCKKHGLRKTNFKFYKKITLDVLRYFQRYKNIVKYRNTKNCF